ncbi:hypothetical protein OIU34_24145 [Pararhizobium sp. BT-229]|uniref:hypothetical protein n=1 Tax=Pararhizobium sp. BT-229 TaxID=2986923 RepID=UPI0021F7E2D9|nr:hypothetical protein [Pararhizobium sp. BT-229]MCV9964991.1 hypothetical protein [Pararhizobium sp. BT-229]
MTTLTLPFLTSSVMTVGKSGKTKFGWAEADVTVRDADPSEFSLAYCRASTKHDSYNIYVHDGMFWANAVEPSRKGFDLTGVLAEQPMPGGTDARQDWQRMIGAEPFSHRLMARGRSKGSRPARDWFGEFKTNIRLAPGDGHEEDRANFGEWTGENLVLIEGRLLKRIHAPSFVISWEYPSRKLAEDCAPIRDRSYVGSFGKRSFNPGLHFRLGDPAFLSTWSEAAAEFKVSQNFVRESYAREMLQSLSDALAEHRLSERMTIVDNIAFSLSALADVTETGWEDMGERSVVSIAESIVSTSSPHLHRPGPKRAALEEIKRLVDILHDDRPEDFRELLEDALFSLPTVGEGARRWFIDKALDMWADREISLRPTVAFLPR